MKQPVNKKNIIVSKEIISKWQEIVNTMAEIIDVPAGLIMRVEEPYIEVFSSSKSSANPYKVGKREHLHGSGFYCESVIETRKKLLVPNALQDPIWSKNPDIKLGMISYLGFPLLWPDGDVFGTICVLDLKENGYRKIFEKLILQFKELIESNLGLLWERYRLESIVAERKQAEENEQLVTRVLQILNQYNEKIDAIRDILFAIKKTTQFDAIGIRLKEGEDFPYYQVNGFPSDFVKAEKYLCARDKTGKLLRDSNGEPILECMCGNIIRCRTDPSLPFFTEGGSFWTNSTTKLLASTTEEERQSRTRNRCNGEGYESVALIPLRCDEEIIGLLQLNDKQKDMFTENLIDFFEGIGASIGVALKRKMAEQELKTYRHHLEELVTKRTSELRKSLDTTVNALASVVETRDPYTAGHQKRVTKLACAMAKEMELSNEQIEGLYLAGLLHDIGKITVPAEILAKPSRLTNSEFDIIKTHPQVGYDILKNIAFPWPIADITHQHHERMNGSGYPNGLESDEIIFEAKILAVADVVEAMSSHRPYRPALSLDITIEEISKNKGILYDPQIVDVCLKLLKEANFAFE